MVDAGIGRLLIASLHEGIADVAPLRLEFYENWLSPAGMRDGRIGLAPLGAVLSFLYREEPPANCPRCCSPSTVQVIWDCIVLCGQDQTNVEAGRKLLSEAKSKIPTMHAATDLTDAAKKVCAAVN